MLVIFHKSAGSDILLTQPQLDAITPVLNQVMHRRIPKKHFNQRCEEAMIAAGCPIDLNKQLDATTVDLLNDLPPLSASYEFVLEPSNDFMVLFIKDGAEKHNTALGFNSKDEFEARRPEMTEYLTRRQQERAANTQKMKG